MQLVKGFSSILKDYNKFNVLLCVHNKAIIIPSRDSGDIMNPESKAPGGIIALLYANLRST